MQTRVVALELLAYGWEWGPKEWEPLSVVAGAGCTGGCMARASVDPLASLQSGCVPCSHHRVHDSSNTGPGFRRKYKVKGVKRGTWNGTITASKSGGGETCCWLAGLRGSGGEARVCRKGQHGGCPAECLSHPPPAQDPQEIAACGLQ